MGGWASRLRRYLPRRRRRMWRYVSGRRHSIGVGLFSFLILLAYGYWFLTNDARVQRQVTRYLSRLTGGRVKIDHARFSLLGDIRVRNLRLFPGDGGDVPFFQAPQVLLSHRPSAILLRGRLEPTEIVCVRPRVTLVEDLRTGELNVKEIFPAGARGGSLGGLTKWPAIWLREGELVYLERENGQLLPVGKRPLPWIVTLLPGPEGKTYQLSLEGQGGNISGSGTIDFATGAMPFRGSFGLQGLEKALPRKLRNWKQRYKLQGRVGYAGDARLGISSATTGPGQITRLTANLEDVSMELPPEEGGMKLIGVRGRMALTGTQIEIEKLTGRIDRAGEATFALSGKYLGYEPTSGFVVTIDIFDLPLPLPSEAAGAWGDGVAKLLEQLDPAGPVDVHAKLRRDEAGKIHADAVARLDGVSVRLPYCPLRVEEITGSIALKGSRVELEGLRGAYREAQVEISGWLADPLNRPGGEVRIAARKLPLDRKVREALPERFRRVWDDLAPRGQADFLIHALRKPGEKPIATATIELTGKASMEHVRFPYRLGGLEGRAIIGPGGVVIRSVHGKAGPMHCVVNGIVTPPGGKPEVDLVIEATDLPLDERLAAALPGEARAAYEAACLSGRVDVTKAVVRWERGKPIHFEVPAAAKGVSIRHRQFPYRIESATGRVNIDPRRVKIERLAGRHGRAKINVSGQLGLTGELPGADLKVSASELTLDDELRGGLPASARRGWDLLSPTGLANVTMTCRTPPPGKQGPTEYSVVARPQDARIRYRHFPYPLHLVSGTAVLSPGLVKLDAVTGRTGSETTVLNGEIVTRPGGEEAALRLKAGPVAIDKQLLAALPAGLAETLRLRPGGTVAVDMKSLRIRPVGATTRPSASTSPAGGTTTQPASALAWSFAGRVTLKDAVLDLGLGGKGLSGYVEGEFGCDGPASALTTDADVVVDELLVGSRRLGKFTARLAKKAPSPILLIDRISGRTCGGRVAGGAEVRLAKPARYGLRLSVDNVELAKFLSEAAGDAGAPANMQGLLTGSLRMTGTAGDASSLRATGSIQIARARMYKLPVLLGFLHVVYLTLPTESAFDAADVDYRIQGDKLSFQEIHLQGSALSMVGGGSMDIRSGKLDLTFITGPPRKLPHLGALEEVLEHISGELMTVRVTGTLSKPKTESVPLRSLRATIRELLGEGSQ